MRSRVPPKTRHKRVDNLSAQWKLMIIVLTTYSSSRTLKKTNKKASPKFYYIINVSGVKRIFETDFSLKKILQQQYRKYVTSLIHVFLVQYFFWFDISFLQQIRETVACQSPITANENDLLMNLHHNHKKKKISKVGKDIEAQTMTIIEEDKFTSTSEVIIATIELGLMVKL
ncbi:hypothetical protein C1646_674860 [Rhizophagus diaphanus]|nr:hypothetical protein C1646_674860 [Rhizophagus diaphanus] [Rhizophagus sp. MUCL 43196]